MTTLIAYHEKTEELALFESDGTYWIGSFSPNMTHQNGEPLYAWIRGDWTTEIEGRQALTQLTGNEW